MAVNGSSADAVDAGYATDCFGARRAGRIEAGAFSALVQRTGEQECDVGTDSGRPSGRVSNPPGHTSGSREDT
ncbi:hypothetical protein [Natrialba hulunbeirensis]|uniref:hypothetical protein n=1 Tax=Natrialba hulunbeirensis TaxID=123783 RepID=UPI00126925DF|nr:hypothetical protein [Natrialba hulunbeirensis]